MRAKSTVLASQSVTTQTFTSSVDLGQITGPISFMASISAKTSPNTATIQIQGSNDDVLWDDIGSAVAIANDANAEAVLVQDATPGYAYARAKLAIASGSYVGAVHFCGVE